MHKRKIISVAVASVLAFSGTASARSIGGLEVSGYLRNNTSVFTLSGLTNNGATSMLSDEDHDSGDVLSFENSARFFINGDIGDWASWHADVNLIYDTEGVHEGSIDYRDHTLYSQYDYLRELYVDAAVAGWDFRLGKQQVVWGTADGIKLLDIINPTDFRFLNQSTMEDSRIPIWMLNASSDITDNGNIQFIVSQVQENLIPGLNQGGDPGQPFILNGVATITGETGGFLNVAPALANVAGSFTTAATLGLINGVPSPLGLVPTSGLTVDGFANNLVDIGAAPGAILLPGAPGYGTGMLVPGYSMLGAITQCGLDFETCSDPNGNRFITNLMPVNSADPTDTSWNPANVSSAFEHMPMATFATFNTFATFDQDLGLFTGADSSYRRDYPSDSNVNAGFRWKQFLDNGLNYSVNYFYHYGSNPDIDLGWHDAVTGERLTEQLSPAGDFINNETGQPGPDGIPDLADFTQSLSLDQLPTDLTQQLPATTLLRNGAGEFYGAFDPTGGFAGYNPNPVELRFTESLHRMHSIGGAFDYAVDTDFAPVVLRGEFLYDMDDTQPVVNRQLLSNGALASSLKMEDADYFKYVIGVDVTVMTNLLVSGQFIQYWNLDYVNDKRGCTTQTGVSVECSRYTADFANISIENGLQRGYKNKEFYSLFFSKPFGESQRGRWNNITIYEEGGGWWNRFDVEYSFSDNLVGTLAWNHYWGEENTTFGQFHDSSNFGLGVKYIFD